MLFRSKARIAAVMAAVVPAGGAISTYVVSAASAGSDVRGTVTGVGEGTVTVQTTGAQTVMVAVNAATVVKIQGKAAALGDLKLGMHAMAIGPSGQPARGIRAYLSATK